MVPLREKGDAHNPYRENSSGREVFRGADMEISGTRMDAKGGEERMDQMLSAGGRRKKKKSLYPGDHFSSRKAFERGLPTAAITRRMSIPHFGEREKKKKGKEKDLESASPRSVKKKKDEPPSLSCRVRFLLFESNRLRARSIHGGEWGSDKKREEK